MQKYRKKHQTNGLSFRVFLWHPMFLRTCHAHKYFLSSTILNFELHLPHPPHYKYVSATVRNEERANERRLPRKTRYLTYLTLSRNPQKNGKLRNVTGLATCGQDAAGRTFHVIPRRCPWLLLGNMRKAPSQTGPNG